MPVSKSLSQWIKSNAGVCTLMLLFCGLYLKLSVFETTVKIDLELSDIDRASLKVYFATKPGKFSENKTRKIRVTKGRHKYSLSLPPLAKPAYLRIDPIDTKGHLIIHEILIQQPGFRQFEFNDKQEFDKLVVDTQHIDSFVLDDSGIAFRATTNDPKISFNLNTDSYDVVGLLEILISLVMISVSCFFCYQKILSQLDVVICVHVVGVVVIGLCLLMAMNSEPGVHPDEALHEKSVNYYKHYTFPPALDAPEAADTYSIYGVTRLASFEIFYPLAGYFKRVTDKLNLTAINSTRLFNIVLIIILFAMAWRYPNFRFFLLPLLLTAQGWYIFSYANSDALGIFICILVSYQVAFPGSLFNQYLTQAHPRYFALTAGFLALLFGTMLLLKVNYYFFALFAGLFVLWRFFIGDFRDKRQFWRRLAIMAVLGLSPFALRYGLDVVKNGFDRDDLYTQMRETHAEPAYKPSRPLEGTPSHLYLRAKGTSAMEMHYKHRWAEKSFRTAFGSYGYTQYHAPDIWYDWVRYCGLFLIVLILAGVVANGTAGDIVLVIIAAGCCVLLFAASFYNSWTVALQPQGRYLMPVLPILGIVYYRFRHLIWKRGVQMMFLCLFLLACYSFVFVGLKSF